MIRNKILHIKVKKQVKNVFKFSNKPFNFLKLFLKIIFQNHFLNIFFFRTKKIIKHI